MDVIRELWSRLRSTLRRGAMEREMDEEIRFHVEEATKRNLARGMAPDQARRQALVAFGGVERHKEAVREESRGSLVETLARDSAYAVRVLRTSPGFTAVAVLTLALGIGANSAIFSVVNGVLLEPLPYADGERLVDLHTQFPGIGFDEFWTSPPEYRSLQELRAFSGVGGWRTGQQSISGGEEPVRVTAAIATAELFETLGVPARLGRPFSREEDQPGGPAVATLSHRLWQSAFGGDPSVVGRSIELNGMPAIVTGIMPPGFDLHDARIDVWTPARIPATPTNFGSHYLELVGRLAPGVSVEQARAEVQAMVRAQAEAGVGHLDPEAHAMVVRSFREEVIGPVRTPLLLLLGAVGFVLLIACANVANLLLAKAETRQREVAVRVAIGAGRGRLVRQFLTEGVTLALAGGALGLLLGYVGLQALLRAVPGSIPRASEISLDPRVLAFTLAVTLATGILFGLAPLLHLGERAVGSALREGGRRSTATGTRQRLRRTLVIVEVALAMVLAVGSGLLLRSLGALHDVDLGFRAENLLTFQLFTPEARYGQASDVIRAYDRILERLNGLPGVSAATAVAGLPPQRDVNANDTEVEGVANTEETPHNIDYYQVVSSGYFETLGIPIVEGRAFRAMDVAEAPSLIVNETLARRYYPGGSAIGRRLRPPFGPDSPWFTIVGVAKDVKQGGVAAATGTELYLYHPQVGELRGNATRGMYVVARTVADPMEALADVRAVIRDIDPALPLAQVKTMEANIAGSIMQARFLTLLLGIFAALALTLAAIGTYGVLAYHVAERRHEIGIRMAMGARAGSVLGMVMKSGLALVAAGLVAGVVGAFALTRLMRSMLFGVSATDPTTFVVAPLLLTVVAILATLIPARRATRVHPAAALRQD
ncbi:MAG TPA: ABC transporter permease [Longimicrobiales bacterium]|nr:ABC transporter permease [Longimicrobiales bacterium]